MNLLLAALILLPAQEDVREELRRMSGGDCGEGFAERYRRLAAIANAALNELPALIKESAGRQREVFIGLYHCIAEWKRIPRTPAVIVNLARAGNLEAARVTTLIGDERAVRFILDCLARLAADERTEDFHLENIVLRAAGHVHSDEVATALLALVDDPGSHVRWLVIDALGTMGHLPAREKLKALTGDPDKRISGVARLSLEKLDVLGAPDREDRLVAHVRGKRMTGEFSWYRWALDWIVHLKLTGAVPALREEYDAFVKKFRAPSVGTDWPTVLLHSIHALDGKLSDEETKRLHEFGRLLEAGAARGARSRRETAHVRQERSSQHRFFLRGMGA